MSLFDVVINGLNLCSKFGGMVNELRFFLRFVGLVHMICTNIGSKIISVALKIYQQMDIDVFV